MELQSVAVIKKVGNKWCVFSEKSNRNLGCAPTKQGAMERLRQVEYFKRSKGSLLTEVAVGPDENSGVLFAYTNNIFLYISPDAIYEGELKEGEHKVELAKLSDKDNKKVPDAYWVISNLYTTDSYRDGIKSKHYDHTHIVVVDNNGNGFTTFDTSYDVDENGKHIGGDIHRHEIKEWEVLEADEHYHRIRGINDEDPKDSSYANSFEVYDITEYDGNVSGELMVFDGLVAVSEDASESIDKIFAELIEAKKLKKKSKKLTRRIRY